MASFFCVSVGSGLQPNRQMHILLIKPHNDTGHDHSLLDIAVLQRDFCDLVDFVQLVEDRVPVHVHGGGGAV